MSTNPVESKIEIVRAHAHNVKRWQPGDMRLRWAATGMLAAAKFHGERVILSDRARTTPRARSVRYRILLQYHTEVP